MKKESEKNMTHAHEDLVENKSFIMKKMTSKEYRDWQLLAASLRGNVKKLVNNFCCGNHGFGYFQTKAVISWIVFILYCFNDIDASFVW